MFVDYYSSISYLFRVCLVGMKTGRMEKERKIGWKIEFSLVWFRRENKKNRKWSEK